MDKTFINIFNGVGDTDVSKTISVLDVIWKISEGYWEYKINTYRFAEQKRKKILKNNLPAVIFSGIFNHNGRLDKDVENYTGIVVCDIDKIQESKLKTYKKYLINDPYVLAFFESPSKGLKVLFKVDSALKYHKSHAFIQLEEYMLETYNIIIDPSGKNPARLCFISHDPELHYNEEAEIMHINTTIEYEEDNNFESVKGMSERIQVSNDSIRIFDVCAKWTRESKIGAYHKGNRNNYVFALSCRLSEAGVNSEVSIMLVCQRYSSLGFSEIKSAVNSAYKITSSTFGTKKIYQKKTNQQSFL